MTAVTDLVAPREVEDMPEAEYHAHPAVSSTFMRHMLPPSCPAVAKYEHENPKHKSAFDLGTVAHEIILGRGAGFIVLDRKITSWQTNAAKAAREEAREAGLVALLAKDHDRARTMADRVLEHRLAGALFTPGSGRSEVSVFWHDPVTGLECRARIDWWRSDALVDLKTIGTSASEPDIARQITNHGYHQQADHYQNGTQALTGERLPWLFVFVESDPPHLVTVAEVDPVDLELAAGRNRRALERIAECTKSGHWPGYVPETEIATISLPAWAQA